MEVYAAGLTAKVPEQFSIFQEQTFSEMQSEIRGITKGRKSHVNTQTPA